MNSKIDTLTLINKTREYLDYIEEHVKNVRKAWEELKVKCKDMPFVMDDYRYFNLESMIEYHDYSKLSAEEFTQYRQYFYTMSGEEKDSKQFELAWENHKKENDHHWETWSETQGDYHYKELNCVHMICDWMAMGYKFGDTAQAYYEKNKDNINIPEEYIDFMYQIFERIE